MPPSDCTTDVVGTGRETWLVNFTPGAVTVTAIRIRPLRAASPSSRARRLHLHLRLHLHHHHHHHLHLLHLPTSAGVDREPSQPDQGQINSVWYRFTPTASGPAHFDTCTDVLYDGYIA